MVTYVFRPQAAIDSTGALVTNGAGQVFDPADTSFSNPLTVRNTAGVNMTTIAVTSIGQTERFTIDDRPHLVWRSGQYIVDIYSLDGMVEATETASAAALQAQQAAEAAISGLNALLASAVRTINGQSPDENGNINVSGGSSGGILTVNDLSPDQAGNVDLTPSVIGAATATHGHSFASGSGIQGVTGTPTSSTFLRGDGVWAAPPSSGGGTGTVTSVNTRTPDGSGNVTINKADINLGAVDNTADADKPVSGPQKAALDLKANDSVVVKLTGNQNVGGTKTFTSAPVVPNNSFSLEKVDGLVAALAAKLAGLNGLTGIWKGSQTAYDALTPDPNVLYVVTGA